MVAWGTQGEVRAHSLLRWATSLGRGKSHSIALETESSFKGVSRVIALRCLRQKSRNRFLANRTRKAWR